MNRRARLAEQLLDHGDLRLPVDVAHDEPYVVPRRQLRVPDHVPGRRPGQRPGKGVREVLEPAGEVRERGVVEADLGVGQVVVVEERQGRHRLTGQAGHLRFPAHHVELHPAAADQLAGVVVVEANRQAVRPQRRVVGRSLLQDGDRTEPAPDVGCRWP